MVWTRLLKKAYRRHPFTSFMATAGAVDVLLGGLEGRVSLLMFGVAAVSLALSFHWRRLQRAQVGDAFDAPSPIRYLPEQTSRPQLPMLGLSRRNPPQKSR